MSIFSDLKHWYERNEERISVASLLGGFFVDYFTLQSIDNVWDNLWISANLFVSGLCIILLNRKADAYDGFWLPNILQFSFGALLGSTFVFYFRSSALSVTWPFLAVLFLAMLANEFFQKKYARLAFQLSLFYFALFSFLIFLVPLLVRDIGPAIFVLSGGMSLFVLWIYIFILHRFVRERFLESRTHIWTFVTVIFIGINVLYFTNLIPPIPLSLKDSGIYHLMEKDTSGNYVVSEEKRGLERYLSWRPKVHWSEGDSLYAYTAVFSPGSINTDIVHEWQYKSENGEWVTATRIPLYLSGGRASGFRTYSRKENFFPGFWRVDVKTPNGQVIGRLNFEIVRGKSGELVTKVKY